ncbi:MAG: hypothetical protein ACR2NZ_18000 [Rubripirellula sp.]
MNSIRVQRRRLKASALLWIVAAGLIGSLVSQLNVLGGEFDHRHLGIRCVEQID